MLMVGKWSEMYTQLIISTKLVTCRKKNVSLIGDVRLPGKDLIALIFWACNRNLRWQLQKEKKEAEKKNNNLRLTPAC